MPAGSTVTVGRSKLQIDCGDGYTVDADWYFRTDDQPPTGLIYLQHGFAARAGFYNTTAAELAERTHSIVVAPVALVQTSSRAPRPSGRRSAALCGGEAVLR